MNHVQDCLNWPWTRLGETEDAAIVGLEVISLDVQERGSVEDEAVPHRLLYTPAMDVPRAPRVPSMGRILSVEAILSV